MSRAVLAGLRRHVPARPVWRCRACAAPWPCQPAKLGLRITYADRPDALTGHLRGLMHDAIADRRYTNPGDVDRTLFQTRFVDWTQRLRPPQWHPRSIRLASSSGPRP